jgi:hypothetical protein
MRSIGHLVPDRLGADEDRTNHVADCAPIVQFCAHPVLHGSTGRPYGVHGWLAGGRADVQRIIGQMAGHPPITSAAVGSYDPAFDPAGQFRHRC